MQRSIDAPDRDWLTEPEAMQYLRLESVHLFQQLVDAGLIIGVRELNRQTRLYHWKGLVIASWRMELGDMPQLPQGGRSSRQTRESSGETA